MDWLTVRDTLDHATIPAFIHANWHHNANDIVLVNNGYNIIYRYRADDSGYYLRINHPVLHSIPKARATLAYVTHLLSGGARVYQPILTKAGDFIASMDNDPAGFYGVVVKEVVGTEIGLDHTDLGVYEAWGRSLGRYHAAAVTFTPPDDIDYTYPTIHDFWENIRETARAQADPLKSAFVEVDEWFMALEKDTFALCHGDYHPFNVIWNAKTHKATTIDFDEPAYHWLISDIVRALLEFHDRPLEERRAYKEAFLRGYRQHHPVQDRWLQEFPMFAQMRGLLMHLWTVQEYANVDDKPDSMGWALQWAIQRYDW